MIDVHSHFLPGIDDGCRDVAESLACLRLMAATGYTRVYCTPHLGDTPYDITAAQVTAAVGELKRAVDAARIPIDVAPGGEIRLSPDMPELLRDTGVPSYNQAGRTVIVDIWEDEWPAWATRAVEWLQKQGLQVVLAHPERMPVLRAKPEKIADIAAVGVKFQGNLGPIAGADSRDTVAAAERFLKEGRYFMVATDGHRISHLPQRLAGLARIRAAVGEAAFDALTRGNPASL